MYIFYIFAIVLAIFFDSHLSSLLGLQSHDEMVLLPLLAYFVSTIFMQKIRYNKIAVSLLLLAFLIILFKWSIGQDFLREVLKLLIIPSLMFICFEHLTTRQSSTLRIVMILFFIMFCTISIAEKVLTYNFFPPSSSDLEFLSSIGYFRSNSIFWHPLICAFFVAFFMAFVAVAEFKKKYIQIFLFLIGYISLFCYDGRTAILVITFIVLPYFVVKLYKTAGKRRWMIILGVICMVVGLVYLITETSLGVGRLMSNELMDESGQSRLDVFKFYKYYKSIDDFLWGHPNLYSYMKHQLGAGGVENGVITLILNYGIIFTPIFLILLFILQYKSLSVFSKFDKWLLLFIFWGIGSTNPNLASSILWTLWVFTYFAFKPLPQNNSSIE